MGGQRSTRHLLYTQTVGALCATDYKWVQQEQVMQGKLIVEVHESDGNRFLQSMCNRGSRKDINRHEN